MHIIEKKGLDKVIDLKTVNQSFLYTFTRLCSIIIQLAKNVNSRVSLSLEVVELSFFKINKTLKGFDDTLSSGKFCEGREFLTRQ